MEIYAKTLPRLTIRTVAAAALLLSSSVYALSDWQPPPAGVVSRIAFGSCAMQWKPQPIWNAVKAQGPDLFLFLGDAIYGDFDGTKPFTSTEESLRRDWDRLASIPDFAALREQVPFIATWDNHDYGSHNGGAEFELKETAKAVFLDFFGEPEDSERRTTPGIYDARVFGPPGKRVQIILGIVDIHWDAEPAPTINLRIVDLEGRDVVRHRIGLDALRHPEAE